MNESTVTAKGQTTIPHALRERLGLQPGTRLVFTELADGGMLVRAKQRSVASLRGMLKPGKRQPIAALRR
jgi:AbrB family looped-hinge helix DNA binding protein